MRVYRIGRTKYANDLIGEGARLFGGRWNHKSIPCIYTSENRALALLEYTVNVNVEEIPRGLSITTFEIPDTDIKVIPEENLPGNWKSSPAPTSAKDLGSQFLTSLIKPVLKIPSSIITQEYNFVLNPLHSASKDFKIVSVHDFVYDIRIKNV
jgi:RES domain-containing protein